MMVDGLRTPGRLIAFIPHHFYHLVGLAVCVGDLQGSGVPVGKIRTF